MKHAHIYEKATIEKERGWHAKRFASPPPRFVCIPVCVFPVVSFLSPFQSFVTLPDLNKTTASKRRTTPLPCRNQSGTKATKRSIAKILTWASPYRVRYVGQKNVQPTCWARENCFVLTRKATSFFSCPYVIASWSMQRTQVTALLSSTWTGVVFGRHAV